MAISTKKFLREVHTLCEEEGMPIVDVQNGRSHLKATMQRSGQTRMMSLSMSPSCHNVMNAIRREVRRLRRDIDGSRPAGHTAS